MAKKKVASPAGNPHFDVGRLGQKKISNPIRCGVVGLGRIGWCHHARVVQEHNGFDLVAVCDILDERMAEALDGAPGCAGYKRFPDMLKNDLVELVIVATQSKDHEPMAIKALNARKHVLVEKPATRTARGMARMIAASKKAGKKLTVHHNYRLAGDFLMAKAIIDSGKLGKIFRIKRRAGGFGRRNDWQVLLKRGGGMTGNWGVHLVDQGLQLMNAPVKSVWGSVRQVICPGDAEDDVKAVIEGKNGVVLDVDMTSADASKQPGWVVMGDRGTMWMDDEKVFIKRITRKPLPKIKVYDLPCAPDRKYGIVGAPDRLAWKEEELPIRPKLAYESYYDNLYRAVRRGAKLVVEPESARVTYDVLERIRKGSRF